MNNWLVDQWYHCEMKLLLTGTNFLDFIDVRCLQSTASQFNAAMQTDLPCLIFHYSGAISWIKSN